MEVRSKLRSLVKRSRRRGAFWVRLLDVARRIPTSEGRSILFTALAHGREVHQTTAYTADNRYPEIFDLAARLSPAAERILSFGCSTGEELVALRACFPSAHIVGAEINPRSRRMAARRTAGDLAVSVVRPSDLDGSFDLVFALAVFQREPHKIAEMEVRDLSAFYPFERFDRAVTELVRRLRRGGLLCVMHAQYPVEQSSVGTELEPVHESPTMREPLFGSNGRRLNGAIARTIFRKLS